MTFQLLFQHRYFSRYDCSLSARFLTPCIYSIKKKSRLETTDTRIKVTNIALDYLNMFGFIVTQGFECFRLRYMSKPEFKYPPSFMSFFLVSVTMVSVKARRIGIAASSGTKSVRTSQGQIARAARAAKEENRLTRWRLNAGSNVEYCCGMAPEHKGLSVLFNPTLPLSETVRFDKVKQPRCALV